MTVAALLRSLRDLGISLETDGENLRYRARPDAMSPGLRAELRAHKQAVMEALQPVASVMHDQERDDARRWEGVDVARAPPIEVIAAGPYRGFWVVSVDRRPDPARAEKCLREAREWKNRKRGDQ